jgi:GNAT superfamily N-acetyltransferase
MLGHHGTSRQSGGQTVRSSASPAHWEGTVRELRPTQLYHYQWHLMRLEVGWHGVPFSGALGGRWDEWDRVVLGCFVDGHMRGAIQLRSPQSDRAREVVLSVEKAWQGRGIGRALMAGAIAVARGRGIGHLYLSCHALNRRIQRIAETFGGKIEFEDGACFAEIAVSRELAAPQSGGPCIGIRRTYD